jgi:purine-binding chemotaxis protein CheW
MNSAPALDDYLMELLGDVGVVAAPVRPPSAAVVVPTWESEEAVDVSDPPAAESIAAGVADPAVVASIIEEMEKEFAPRPEPAVVAEPIVEPSADTPSAAPVIAPVVPPMPPRAAPAAAPASLPTSTPPVPLPPSGSPAMTLFSPIATPKALPPLPSKPFLQTPIESGARRRAAEPTTRWLRMRCDEQHYALELLKVQEVVLPGALLPLRGAARHMLGVMNLRGQVVPVLDLGLYLGRRAIEPDASTRIVVLEEQGEILGLRVSAVEDVTNLTEQQIEPPDNARVGRIANHLFRGVARLHERAVILLDASQLLR